MLRYFRRIRKRLAENGNFSKYLFYAIGEIALVVIGILIALQINNNNEFKRERVKEKKVLSDIATSLENNYLHLIDRADWNQILNESSDIIIKTIEQKGPFDDSLIPHFSKSIIQGNQISISTAGYEALKNAGFDLISNEELRNKIIVLYTNTYSYSINGWNSYELSKPMYESHIYKLFYEGQGGLYPFDYQSVLNDTYYYSLIKLYKKRRLELNVSLEFCAERTQHIISQINQELGEQ